MVSTVVDPSGNIDPEEGADEHANDAVLLEMRTNIKARIKIFLRGKLVRIHHRLQHYTRKNDMGQ